ncbi:bleomycin resistance protein [Serinibacter arcticus]|uniref:Bleomycin resistance protein n=1 Tax=Serinibacter arcticus TaxID=1655435 RepID=A0A2U1ZX91_9MICO|nr:VOC family protein [Serinibacter arcticus]PWD51607.1 bleomycin resistance protein [Serinibacter arcticus]
MSIAVTPHLNFRGDARAALEHYRDAFGGELAIATHGEAGPVEDPSEVDLVIWGQVAAPSGFRIMAFDVPAARPWDQGVASFFVSVRTTDGAELAASFEVLAQDGTVVVPLGPSPWSPLYGMVTDRFGVTWVLDVEVAHAG